MRSNLDECDEFYMTEEVMNRDYFAKPYQTSRSQHDYGNMGKIVAMERESDQREGSGLFALMAGIVVGSLLTIFWSWVF